MNVFVPIAVPIAYFLFLRKVFVRLVTCISLTGQWWMTMMSRKRSSHHLPASRLVSSGLQVYQLDYKFEPRHPLSSSAHTHPMKSWTLDMGGMIAVMMITASKLWCSIISPDTFWAETINLMDILVLNMVVMLEILWNSSK